MKKTLITLLMLAGIVCGADYSFETTFADGAYDANNGANYYGIAFTFDSDSDRYTASGGYTGMEQTLYLTSITLTVRYGQQYSMPTDLSLIVTDSSGSVLGWAAGNTQKSTNKGLIDGYTRTYATYKMADNISVDTDATYYAYFSTADQLEQLIEDKGNGTLTLSSSNYADYAKYGQALAVTRPLPEGTVPAYTNTETAEWNVLSGLGTLNHSNFAPVMSVSVTSIPEPTSTTLSLLTLAGLAARRRRK